MTVYWLSYRLEDRSTRTGTYGQRHDALMLVLETVSSIRWTQTTSFAVFSSDLPIVPAGMAFRAAVDPEVDVFLLREMDGRSAVICGKNRDNGIRRLMLGPDGATYLREV